MNEERPLCFVIGPIGQEGSAERKQADLMLNLLVRHVLESELGYRVKRGDEDTDPGMIGDRMISDIIDAELVVADLTGLNANALYELGIRHFTAKPTIHIAQHGTPLPFDNAAHRTLFVDPNNWTSLEPARTKLASIARTIKQSSFKVTNPVTQVLANTRFHREGDDKERTIEQLRAQIESLRQALLHRNSGPTAPEHLRAFERGHGPAIPEHLRDHMRSQSERPKEKSPEQERFERLVKLCNELRKKETSVGKLQIAIKNFFQSESAKISKIKKIQKDSVTFMDFDDVEGNRWKVEWPEENGKPCRYSLGRTFASSENVFEKKKGPTAVDR